MSDPLDGDPDELFEPDSPASEYEQRFDGESPGEQYESRFDGSSAECESADIATQLADSDVDPAVRRGFWKVFVAVKLTLLVLTLGVLFVAFGESVSLGSRLLVFGVVLAGYTGYQYRKSKRRIEAVEPHTDGSGETDTDERTTAETETPQGES